MRKSQTYVTDTICSIIPRLQLHFLLSESPISKIVCFKCHFLHQAATPTHKKSNAKKFKFIFPSFCLMLAFEYKNLT